MTAMSRDYLDLLIDLLSWLSCLCSLYVLCILCVWGWLRVPRGFHTMLPRPKLWLAPGSVAMPTVQACRNSSREASPSIKQ